MGAPDSRVPVLVPLGAIALDASTQVRTAISERLVAEYAESMAVGDKFPPVVLFYDGSTYYMADGFHRMLAAQQIQVSEIAADVRPGTKMDALWYALGANRTHGQRLTSGDKQHAVRLALEIWPELSAVQIAEQIGCADTYVSRIRNKVRTSANLPDRVVGKDGKRYPATKHTATTAATKTGERHMPDRSPAAVAKQRQRIREMAADGCSRRQIAEVLKLSEKTVVKYAKQDGVDIHADRIVGRTRRHDPNRIVARTAIAMEHICADFDLVDFRKIDLSQVSGWFASFTRSREQLGAFMRRLVKEQGRCAHD